MPNPAEKQGFQESADTTGLEDIFSSHDKDSQEDLTLDEAAKKLNLSERTIQRRLKLGQLQGYKIPGPRGPEWRITLKSSDDMTGHSSLSIEEETKTPVDTTIISAMSTEDKTVQQDGIGAQAIIQLSDFYRDQVETLQEKLEAATYRNGYLEAQLSNAENQLKLIPDLSAKATRTDLLQQEMEKLQSELATAQQGFFSHFIKWFMGKK